MKSLVRKVAVFASALMIGGTSTGSALGVGYDDVMLAYNLLKIFGPKDTLTRLSLGGAATLALFEVWCREKGIKAPSQMAIENSEKYFGYVKEFVNERFRSNNDIVDTAAPTADQKNDQVSLTPYSAKNPCFQSNN